MISTEEKIAILKNTEIFSKISPQYLEAIAKRMGQKEFSAGSYLFREEDAGDGMLIIYHGQVEVIKGENIVLAVLGEGDILGEMAPILGGQRSTSARAKENVQVLFLRREALWLLIHKIPDMSLGLMQLIARRLAAANALIQNLEESPVKGKYGVHIETGAQKDARIPIAKSLIIGRGDDQKPHHLYLKGGEKSKISRRHAEIFCRNGSYFLKDLGSRNGTKLNDVQLAEIISLADGDKIGIGEVIISFYKEG